MNVISIDSARRRIAASTAVAAAAAERYGDLEHYAAGISGLNEVVQAAALSVMDAPDFPAIVRTVVTRWPRQLGVDMAALALAAGDHGLCATPAGITRLPGRRIRSWTMAAPPVEVRSIGSDLEMFGESARGVRTAAIIPLTLSEPLGHGLLIFGSRSAGAPELMGGSEMLAFLGQTLSRMIARCQTQSF